MAQHARPVGPTTVNAAAAFEPAMITGVRAPTQANQRVANIGPRPVGCISAQTTHVAAPFVPAMTTVTDRPSRPYGVRPVQPVSERDWQAPPPEVQPFSIEMVRGARPDTPRLPKLASTPLVDSPATVHASAPFSQDMVKGWVPDRRNLFVEPRSAHLGWLSDQAPSPVGAPDSTEMYAGSLPSSPRIFTFPKIGAALSQTTPVAAAISVEMLTGWQPLQKREHLPAKPGWCVSQVTQVDAAITVDMLAGWRVDRNRERLPVRTGLVAQVADVQPFSIEMAVGSHPDAGRLFLAPRIPLPLGQPWHRDAAVSVEMLTGCGPDRKRDLPPSRPGWSHSELTIVSAPLTLDMVVGVSGIRGKDIVRLDRRGVVPPEVQTFSIEMAIGARPDSPRLFLPLRRGVQLEQAVHLAAAVSIDMLRGSGPDGPRLSTIRREMLSAPPDVSAFSVEMAIGSHPDTSRAFPPHRLGLVDAGSAVDIGARFGQEMVAGWAPTRSCEVLPLRHGWTVAFPLHPLLFALADVFVLVRQDVATIQIRVDADTIVVRPDQQTLLASPDATTITVRPDIDDVEILE